jgi:hypothetical protein
MCGLGGVEFLLLLGIYWGGDVEENEGHQGKGDEGKGGRWKMSIVAATNVEVFALSMGKDHVQELFLMETGVGGMEGVKGRYVLVELGCRLVYYRECQRELVPNRR